MKKSYTYLDFRNRRKELGFSQAEAAEYCHVSIATVNKFEKGLGINLSTKMKLFEIFDDRAFTNP